jgi:hypothetical protein
MGVEEDRRRLEQVRFEEQDVEMKEVIEKATTKKEVPNNRGSKRDRKEK